MESHDDPNINNRMTPRTHGCIELGPNRNIQGTYNVFCMNSVIVLKRRNIIPMIAADQIIKIVDDWGKTSRIKQYGRGIDISNRNKELFDRKNR